LERLLAAVATLLLGALGLSLHNGADALTEGLGELLRSTALLSTLSACGLLGFIADPELVVSTEPAAVESLGLTWGAYG